jgi:hypothetical protein
MSDAINKAKKFLNEERAFRLGELLTESSHPKKRTLLYLQTNLSLTMKERQNTFGQKLQILFFELIGSMPNLTSD